MKKDPLVSLLRKHYGRVPVEAEDSAAEGAALWLLNAERQKGGEFGSKDMSDRLRKAYGDGVRVRDFTKDLTYQGEEAGRILTVVKPWLWSVVKRGLRGESVLNLAAEYGVDPYDRSLRRFLPTLRRACRSLTKRYEDHSQRELAAMGARCAVELERTGYVRKFVWRRLRFIAQGDFQWDLDDLGSELLMTAHRDVLVQYPKVDSELHFLNIMKGSISRRGANLAARHSGDNPNAVGLVRVSEGKYALRTVPIGDYGELDPIIEDGEDEDPLVEVRRKFAKGKRRRIVDTLMGYDPEFGPWLSESGGPSYDDLLSDLKSGGDLYYRLVARFLGLRTMQVKKTALSAKETVEEHQRGGKWQGISTFTRTSIYG